MTRTLRLQLLASRFNVVVDDPRMATLIARLFEPFATGAIGDGGTPVRGVSDDDTWTLRVGDTDPWAASDPWGFLTELRNGVVQIALENARGVLDVHAAVLTREEDGLLIVGRPWAGKTTFSLELARRGWGYFSDDVAPLELANGRIAPFPKPLLIKNGSWDDCLHLWHPRPAWLPRPEGWFLVPATTLVDRRRDRVRPRWIVFLDYVEGDGARARPLTTAEAVASFGPHIPRLSSKELRALIALCEGATAVAIDYGSVNEGLNLLLRTLFQNAT